MISIEVEGKTPEEAIEKALEVLDAAREKVKVEVLDEGSKGLFGMIGSKQAKIKATLLEGDDEVTPDEDFAPRPSVTASKPARPVTSDVEDKGVKVTEEIPAKKVLEEILDLMGFNPTIEQKMVDGKITLSIEAGEDSNILIGKRGKNLNGLQYVVNRICGRINNGAKPVVIDIEGYRQRRRESLEAMAGRLAAKAKSSKKEVETEPLSASDRRLVHMALKSDSEVQTQSRGDGPYKNVVVKPRKR